ncbi:MAG: STAS domain-containing protein [Candidatus Brocadiae bacterium]|nr:STAS domain-containing protein [Candidatus Brocadiia bacterium]
MSIAEQLRGYLEDIKKNPQNAHSWEALGNAALDIKENSMAAGAYLSAFYLNPENTLYERKFYQVLNELKNSKENVEFTYEIFRLPLQTAIIFLFGLMNTELRDFEGKLGVLAKGGFDKILLDFSNVQALSGLGPSLLRKILEYVKQKDGKILIHNANQNIKTMLELKKVDIPYCSSLKEGMLLLKQ